MNHDDFWSRYFNLPDLPDLPARQPVHRRTFQEMLFPRCLLCGEVCGELFG